MVRQDYYKKPGCCLICKLECTCVCIDEGKIKCFKCIHEDTDGTCKTKEIPGYIEKYRESIKPKTTSLLQFVKVNEH